MLKVKCSVTGIEGYDYEFYRAENGKYYKTKDIYDNWEEAKKYNKKIYWLINSQILNKKPDNCIYLIGHLIKQSGLKSKNIYETLSRKMAYILQIIGDSTESDSGKIHLIFAIVTNRLNNVTYAGCYEIRNKETNEVYVGESIDLFNRFTIHISELYSNTHHCKQLQEAFNKTKNIANFKITPLFMFPVVSVDKNEIKHETLYLEAAFYLKLKEQGELLYNTQNPFAVLKQNKINLDGYHIDCKNVLFLLANDKYGILPATLLKKIREVINNHCEQLNQESQNAKDVCEWRRLYKITELLNKFVQEEVLPINYDYNKVRKILQNNGLITISPSGRTVATEYATSNELFIVNSKTKRNGEYVYSYLLTEKCRDLFLKIFSNIEDISTLAKNE